MPTPNTPGHGEVVLGDGPLKTTLCSDPRRGRFVVVRRVVADVESPESQAAVGALREEVAFRNAVEHGAIPTLLARTVDEDRRPIIVVSAAVGPSLDELLWAGDQQGGAVPPGIAVRIARTLAHAHHRLRRHARRSGVIALGAVRPTQVRIGWAGSVSYVGVPSTTRTMSLRHAAWAVRPRPTLRRSSFEPASRTPWLAPGFGGDVLGIGLLLACMTTGRHPFSFSEARYEDIQRGQGIDWQRDGKHLPPLPRNLSPALRDCIRACVLHPWSVDARELLILLDRAAESVEPASSCDIAAWVRALLPERRHDPAALEWEPSLPVSLTDGARELDRASLNA